MPSSINEEHISIYYQNVRGLNTKIDVFSPNVSDCEYHIIALSETWLKSDVISSELFPNHYEVYRSDRNFEQVGLTSGGGVLIAIDNTIKSEVIDTSQLVDRFPAIDFLVCKCFISVHFFYIAIVYIPPSVSLEYYEDFFDFLENLDVLNTGKVIFVGDFNCAKFIDNNIDDGKTCSIMNLLAFLDMKQCNNISNSCDRLLDLVISNLDCSVTRDYVTLVPEDNYHPSLSIRLKEIGRKQDIFDTNAVAKTYNFKKANYYALYNDFLHTDWRFLESVTEVDAAVNSFYNKFYKILDTHVPVYKNYKHTYPMWYTGEIIKLIKDKAKQHRKFKKTKNVIYYQQFSRYRLLIKQRCREAYELYLQNVQIKLKQEPRYFWSFINNKNNTSRIPGKMFYNNETYDNPQSIVNAFSIFFKSVYSLPHADEEVLNFNFNRNIFLDVSCEPITENEILRAGKKLKNKFTSGPDKIPSFLFKDCLRVLVQPLQLLFNLVLETSVFPDLWKTAKVCPIHKSDSRANINNYRPIAILNNAAKVLETILYNRVYLSAKNLISIYQHGFMNSRSTISNLAVFSQYLCETLDSRGQIDVVYTDFSKAFDKIGHNILLQKLLGMGINGNYLQLLKSYLSQRKQYVYYNGFNSNIFFATSGVPQGSNLGPLLFLIFINDLCEALHCNRLMFADDLKLYVSINTLDDCIFLQQQINMLQDWCNINKLYLNISKCKILTCTRKFNAIIFPYAIDNVILERTTTFKDLGIHFDSQLTFNYHISCAVSSACRSYGFIVRNCKSFNNISALSAMYFTLVRSGLEYGSLIWNPIYAHYTNLVERIQKKFLKFLSFKLNGSYPPRGCDYDGLLSRYNFISLEKRRDESSVLFLHGLLNGKVDCPNLLSQIDIFVPRLTSRYNNTFLCKRAQTNIMLKAPINYMCTNANKLSNFCDIFSCSVCELKHRSRSYL